MTLTKARALADEAAESAQLDADTGDTLRLLAEAVAELAKSLDRRLTSIEQDIRSLQSQVRQIR